MTIRQPLLTVHSPRSHANRRRTAMSSREFLGWNPSRLLPLRRLIQWGALLLLLLLANLQLLRRITFRLANQRRRKKASGARFLAPKMTIRTIIKEPSPRPLPLRVIGRTKEALYG